MRACHREDIEPCCGTLCAWVLPGLCEGFLARGAQQQGEQKQATVGQSEG